MKWRVCGHSGMEVKDGYIISSLWTYPFAQLSYEWNMYLFVEFSLYFYPMMKLITHAAWKRTKAFCLSEISREMSVSHFRWPSNYRVVAYTIHLAIYIYTLWQWQRVYTSVPPLLNNPWYTCIALVYVVCPVCNASGNITSLFGIYSSRSPCLDHESGERVQTS